MFNARRQNSFRIVRNEHLSKENMYLSKTDIQNTETKRRLNLINSISGIKAANLIGTVNGIGQTNLAIFNSVMHIGSHPALLGFIMRPDAEVRRHTYENITETGFYTINAVPMHLSEKAHFTSAKFDQSVSEFDACSLQPEFLAGFSAPFVSQSPIQIGMQFQDEIPIKINGTILIIGSVEHLFIADNLVNEKGYIDFQKANLTGVGGLNTYYSLQQINQFPYARVNELPKFND